MEDDWDLYAVVRGCGAGFTSVAAADAHNQLSISTDSVPDFTTTFSWQDLYDEPRREGCFIVEDLHDLCKPFFTNSIQLQQPATAPAPAPAFSEIGAAGCSTSSPISAFCVLGDPSLSEHHHHQPPPQQYVQQTEKQPTFTVSDNSLLKASASHNNPSARTSSKRRKNNVKRVCHVPAESLCSDMWSWRKYGQKPIKGSPYPRGYYKCSTLKGCLARKQVERNKSDPGMFIITYAGEHNHPMPTHRNSLAGCTRQKSAAPPNPDKPSCSSDKLESSLEDLLEVEDDDLSVSDMALDDDFLAGLEDLGGPLAGNDTITDDFPENLQFPWHGEASKTTPVGLMEDN